MSNLFWAIISGLAGIITIGAWMRGHLKENKRMLVYPALIVILTVISTWQAWEVHQYRSYKKEAKELVNSWPLVRDLDFVSKGERIGIILRGMQFIENTKDQYPDTYELSRRLVMERIGSFQVPDGVKEEFEEFSKLEDVAGAVISLISTIADK